MTLPLLFALIFPACLIWAAVSDLTTMTIPNKLSIILAVMFVPVAVMLKPDLMFIAEHLGIGVLAFVLGIVAFALRFMGGGDAKLIAATALWFHFQGFLVFLAYVALAGGALTILLLVARQFLQIFTPVMPAWLQKLLEPKGDIPYGIAICAGGLLAIPHSNLYPLLGL
ncbi:A24 family peptidase [Asticcacaulis tiandongensis]|uniref:A24 family peptidase n=1 Tax=Asticcacaulis tiandongensis TaxID=2565365 RepID=UPI00112E8967|nr:prepilin peptidase [Asticcacaulis tiandongensis]